MTEFRCALEEVTYVSIHPYPSSDAHTHTNKPQDTRDKGPPHATSRGANDQQQTREQTMKKGERRKKKKRRWRSMRRGRVEKDKRKSKTRVEKKNRGGATDKTRTTHEDEMNQLEDRRRRQREAADTHRPCL